MSELLASKKFQAALIGVVFVIVNSVLLKIGIAIPRENLLEILGILATYVLGQGIADHGKEAARITASVPSSPAVTVATVVDNTKEVPDAK